MIRLLLYTGLPTAVLIIGLTILYNFNSRRKSKKKRRDMGFIPLSTCQDPVVDIIAIHGLDGHRVQSWTAEDGTMWLKDLLPEDLPNARILSYGYDADTHSFAQTSSQTIFRHAEAFVENLSMLRTEPKRPIIFLAHNLGGIVLKKALDLCNVDSFESEHEFRDILVSTLAVLFFGTPHSGADVVQLADWMRRLFSVYMYTNNRIIADLKRDSSELEDIQRLYLPASGHFKTIFFHEEYVTPIVGGKPEVIVPRPLAVIQGDGKAKPVLLHANHPQLIKYTGKEDVNYRKVVGYLSKLLKNPTTNHLSQPSIRQPQKFQTTVEINTPLFD